MADANLFLAVAGEETHWFQLDTEFQIL